MIVRVSARGQTDTFAREREGRQAEDKEMRTVESTLRITKCNQTILGRNEAPAATRIDRLEHEPFISSLPIPILDARAFILPRHARANEPHLAPAARHAHTHSMVLLRAAGRTTATLTVQDAPGSSDTITAADLHPAPRRRLPTPSLPPQPPPPSPPLPSQLPSPPHLSPPSPPPPISPPPPSPPPLSPPMPAESRQTFSARHTSCARPRAIPALSAACATSTTLPATLPDDCPNLHADQPPRL